MQYLSCQNICIFSGQLFTQELYILCFRYMVDGGNQPGIATLKAARIFDPATATLLSSAKEEYDSHIPSFKDVSMQE